jgi:hypothetical protein
MKGTSLAVAVVCLVGLAAAAGAGGQQVVAEASKDGRSVVVRTYDCGTPASLNLSGTAEGLVDGARRTVPLAIARGAEPGVFSIARQWPVEGQWALVLTVVGGHAASTLVTLQPGETVRIAGQKMAFERPSAERIAALGTR